jgi:Phage portal protein
MASRGAVLRGAQSIPGGARPTPAPQGSGGAGYNNGRGLNAPSIGQISPLAAQLANEGGYARAYGPFLPRPTQDFTAGAFGPFSPILPVPVDSPPEGLDRPEARRWQYPVGWNLPTGQPGDEGLKLASFEQLRRLADVYSVARAAIEFRKNQVRGIEWDIIPTPDAAKAYQNQPAKMAEFGKRQAKAKKFFKQPDRDYLSYSTWIGAVLEDVFVYDALSLLIRPTRVRGKGVLGGNMDSLMTITGSTIRPLVDLHGGTPRPPCYSDDTEILTRGGWKLFKDLKRDEEVATRSSNGIFEWQAPIAYVNHPYTGPMIHFSSRSIDCLVTPDHRMLTTIGPEGRSEQNRVHDDQGHFVGHIDGKNGTRREWLMPAQYLLEKTQEWSSRGKRNDGICLAATSVWAGKELCTATFTATGQSFMWADSDEPIKTNHGPNLPISVSRLPYTDDTRGIKRNGKCEPGCTCGRHNLKHNQPVTMTGDQYAAFMGMYLSEGSINHDPVKWGYSLFISQTGNGKGGEEFGQLIDEIFGIKPYIRHGELSGWSIKYKALWRYLHQFGYAKDKFAPPEILDMSKRQLEIFWHYYCLGDGHEVRYSRGRPQAHRTGAAQYAVATSSQQMADDFQEIIQKLGYSASVRESGDGCYRMYARTTEYPSCHATEVNYSGRVHCVTVPNGVVYVRRNGNSIWSGNSPAFQQFLFGVPRSDYMTMITGEDLEEAGLTGMQAAQFRGDQLIYAPMVARDWTPYGFGPVERALIPIRTGIAKQAYQFDWFEESTVPAAYIIPGDTAMTPNQLRELQDALNAIAGDPAWKQKLIVLPPGSHVEPQRPTVAADELDQLVMTQVCMSFAVSPMELGISPRASATTSPGAANQMAKAAQSASKDSGLTPILKYLQDIFNEILVNVCGQSDMMFMFEGLQEEEDVDSLTGVLVQQMQNGMRTIDECRQELNLQPYGLEESSEPLIVTPQGPVPLSTAVQNAQNAAAQAQAQTAQTQASTASTQAGTEATQSRTQMAQESHEVSMNTPPPPPPDLPAGAAKPKPTGAAGAEGKAEAASAAGKKPTPGHNAAVAANNAAASAKKAEAADDIIAKVIITDPLAQKRAAAELEALTRHLVKGRHVSTWEPRYLTHGMLAEIAKSMAEGLAPREAASRVSVKNVALPASEYAWQDGDNGAGEAGGAPFQGVEAADLVKAGPEGYTHGFICVRPPCGEKPASLDADDLKVQKDGGVIHTPSGYAVGHAEKGDTGAFIAHHADGASSVYRTRKAAVSGIAHRYNSGATDASGASSRYTAPKITVPEAASPSAIQPAGVSFRNIGDTANWQATVNEMSRGRAAAGLGLPALPGREWMIARKAFKDWANQADYDRIRKAMPAVIGGKPVDINRHSASSLDDIQAAAILRMYSLAPKSAEPLYRGMHSGGAALVPGKKLSVRVPSSFSSDIGEARGFTGLGKGAVLLEIEPGAKALDISRINDFNQAESVSMGSFEVISVSTDATGVKRVKLRQVNSGIS